MAGVLTQARPALCAARNRAVGRGRELRSILDYMRLPLRTTTPRSSASTTAGIGADNLSSATRSLALFPSLYRGSRLWSARRTRRGNRISLRRNRRSTGARMRIHAREPDRNISARAAHGCGQLDHLLACLSEEKSRERRGSGRCRRVVCGDFNTSSTRGGPRHASVLSILSIRRLPRFTHETDGHFVSLPDAQRSTTLLLPRLPRRPHCEVVRSFISDHRPGVLAGTLSLN